MRSALCAPSPSLHMHAETTFPPSSSPFIRRIVWLVLHIYDIAAVEHRDKWMVKHRSLKVFP